MNPIVVGTVVFACSLGGALVGMWLSTILAEHHLNKKSEDAVKLGIGLIATMTALVLSVVTASAKSSIDALDTAVKDTASDIRSLQSRAVELSEALLQARWLVFAGGGASILLPFLVVLTFWLTITFVSYGLFAPRNATVFSVLFVCALSVGSAVFLILEMDGPFDGVFRVSGEPLRNAVAHLNQ